MLETLQIPYVINTNMVRGLDYYNHTIFEFTTEVAGSQLTICAGGRYDGLVAYFGGPETPGVGFGMGLERLLLVLDKQGVELPIETALDVYVAVLGPGANGRALELVQALRTQALRQRGIISTASSRLSSNPLISLKLKLLSPWVKAKWKAVK